MINAKTIVRCFKVLCVLNLMILQSCATNPGTNEGEEVNGNAVRQTIALDANCRILPCTFQDFRNCS